MRLGSETFASLSIDALDEVTGGREFASYTPQLQANAFMHSFDSSPSANLEHHSLASAPTWNEPHVSGHLAGSAVPHFELPAPNEPHGHMFGSAPAPLPPAPPAFGGVAGHAPIINFGALSGAIAPQFLQPLPLPPPPPVVQQQQHQQTNNNNMNHCHHHCC